MAKVKFYDHSDRCVAVISFALPGGGAGATVAGVGDDRAEALARAASIAHRIATDPVMSALMPPQAQAAIVAARGLAAAAKRGLPVLKSFWRRIKGPGKKRLARALMEEAAKHRAAAVADVGWNPFKRKRKPRRMTMATRRPPPMQRPMPRPEPDPEPEPEPEPEQYDDGAPANEQYDDGAEVQS